MRAPEAPIGCPSAIAPPLTLTLSCGNCNSRFTAIDCAAKASFNSKISTSSITLLERFKALRIASTGPMPIIEGATPLAPKLSNTAIGCMPKAFALSSVITSIAAAPSLIPDALPAVTDPSFLNAGRSCANLSIVV